MSDQAVVRYFQQNYNAQTLQSLVSSCPQQQQSSQLNDNPEKRELMSKQEIEQLMSLDLKEV